MKYGDEAPKKVKKSYRDIREMVGGRRQNDEIAVYSEDTFLK